MSRSPLKPRFFAKKKAKGGFFSSSSEEEEEDEKKEEVDSARVSKSSVERTTSFRLGSLRISKIKKRARASGSSRQDIKCPRCKIQLSSIRELTRHAAECKGWEGTQEAMNLLKVDLRPKRIFGPTRSKVIEADVSSSHREDDNNNNEKFKRPKVLTKQETEQSLQSDLVAELEKELQREVLDMENEQQQNKKEEEEVVVVEEKNHTNAHEHKEVVQETVKLKLKIQEVEEKKQLSSSQRSEHERIENLRSKLLALKEKKKEMIARKEAKRQERERVLKERKAEAAKLLEEKRSRRDHLRQELEKLEAERIREEDERQKLLEMEKKLLDQQEEELKELSKIKNSDSTREDGDNTVELNSLRLREEEEEIRKLKEQIESIRKKKDEDRERAKKVSEDLCLRKQALADMDEQLMREQQKERLALEEAERQKIEDDEKKRMRRVEKVERKHEENRSEADTQHKQTERKEQEEKQFNSTQNENIDKTQQQEEEEEESPRKNKAKEKLEKLRKEKKERRLTARRQSTRLLVRAKSVSVTATPKTKKKKQIPCRQCVKCGGYAKPDYPGVFNAASYGHIECLTFYLQEHTDELEWLKDIREYGTALHFASAYGHVEAVKILLSYGALPGTPDTSQGRNSLLYACASNQFNCVAALLEHGPEIIDDVDVHGNTALMIGCTYGYFELVQLLLSMGANPDIQNDEGLTACHLVSSSEVLQILHEYGANMYCVDQHNRSLLFSMSANGHIECCQYLLEIDDEALLLNHPDDRGDTPLHAGSCNGHVECVRLLLQSGADVTKQNVANLTCFELANLANHQECAQLISEYDVSSKEERRPSLTCTSPTKKISFKSVSKLKVIAHREKRKWHQYLDEDSGYFYYYNTKTGETRWEAPAGFFVAHSEEKEEEKSVKKSVNKETEEEKTTSKNEDEKAKKLREKYIRMAEDYANQKVFQASDKTEDDDETKQTVCTVCQMGVVERKFLPCNHLCCCNQCISALEIEGSELECPCPLCMMPIENIVDIKKKQPKKEKVYGPTKPLPEGFAEKFKKWGLSKNYE